MDDWAIIIENTRTLIARLERISVDSLWAHRSSGLRGSLLRCLDKIESCYAAAQQLSPDCSDTIRHLHRLTQTGYQILENAAREIRPPEETHE